ncbi:hypothetical protein ACFP56_19285 [Paenibacillus septentrionalis]|uniref:Uncharacterized protein n=1 Tax=Paenibacillus septentrionalis TaxID=429342 RepID=A0ABW1V7U2_9BACL
MPKYLSLFFATIGIFFLSAMAISISHSLTWVVIWGTLSLVSIGVGFIVRKRYNRGSNREETLESKTQEE